MSAWLTIIIAFIGSSAMGAIVGLLADAVKRHWEKADDEEEKSKEGYSERIDKIESKLDTLGKSQEAIMTSQKVTMRERIRYLGLCYIGSKKITLDDKETLHKMHAAYKGLGGDGDLNTVMAEIEKLPVVESWTSKSTAKAD